jgi:hypothetical protein
MVIDRQKYTTFLETIILQNVIQQYGGQANYTFKF